MSSIRFSSVMLDAMVAGSEAGNIVSASPTTQPSFLSGGTASTSLLIVYKGTIPTDFTSFTDRSTRSSDVLITFTLGATTTSYTNVGLVNNARQYLIGKALTPVAATASGTASWFLLCRAGTTTLTDKAALMGTVGILGSGADYEIGNVNLVSGTSYTSAGLYLNFPQTWTF